MAADPPGFPDTRDAPPAPGAPAPADEGLAPLPLDAPAEMEVTFSFGVARAFENGWLALKRAPGPMMIAGFLMALLDGSNGGFNGPSGNDYGNDYDPDFDSGYDTYSELVENVGVPLKAAYADIFGDVLHPIGVWAQIGAAEAGLVLGVMLLSLLCIGAIVIAMAVARAFIRPGVIRLHSHILQTGETDTVAVIFSGSDRFLHMLGWELMTMAIGFLVMLVAATPGVLLTALGFSMDLVPLQMGGLFLATLMVVAGLVYVHTGLIFGGHLITLEERSPTEALKRSWMLARGNRLWMVLFVVCAAVLKLVGVVVGVLMCCVGLMVTWPATQAIGDFAFTESFLLLTRGEGVSHYWEFWRMKERGEL